MNFDFKSKLGALPVWAWGTILGLVLVSGYFIYRKQNTSDAASVAQGTALDPFGYQTNGIKGGTAQADDSADAASTTYDSNASWLNRGARETSNKLAASPAAVYQALRKWINGEKVTTQERGWIDFTLTNTGNPPEGVFGLSETVNDGRIVGYGREGDNLYQLWGYSDGTPTTKKKISQQDAQDLGWPSFTWFEKDKLDTLNNWGEVKL